MVLWLLLLVVAFACVEYRESRSCRQMLSYAFVLDRPARQYVSLSPSTRMLGKPIEEKKIKSTSIGKSRLKALSKPRGGKGR